MSTATVPFVLTISACAEWLISFRPLSEIANFFRIDEEGLRKSMYGFQSLTQRGKLETALRNPSERPDLIPEQTHLARQEHQLSLLSRQFHRAERRIETLLQNEEGFDMKQLFQAELFSNRIHQQMVRLTNSIQKNRKALEQAATEPPPVAQTVPKTAPSKAAPQERVPSPQAEPTSENDREPSSPASSQTTASPQMSAPPQLVENSLPAEPNPPSPGGDLPISPPPTLDEWNHCIVKNRHRLKVTPAGKRQALMVRLIEQHRASRAKHAA